MQVLPHDSYELVPITNGLPDWSAYVGTNERTQVSHNFITLGAPNVCIFGPQYVNSWTALQGSYSAILQAGFPGGQTPAVPASIAQTATIPEWAKFIQFSATGGDLTNVLDVSVSGQGIPFNSLGGNSYICDVSAFAGQVQELRFTMNTNDGNGLVFLDAISFWPALGMITSLAKEKGDVRITWQTSSGTTNVVQVAVDATKDGYSNNFTDTSPMMFITGPPLTSTNYVDTGGATNGSSRFYRVRLVP